MAVLIDEDVAHRTTEGVLGLQMHVGDPVRVGCRNIWFTPLYSDPSNRRDQNRRV